MIETSNAHDTRQRAVAQADRLRGWAMRRPWAALALLLGAGMLCGAAVRSAIGMAQLEALQAADAARQQELENHDKENKRKSLTTAETDVVGQSVLKSMINQQIALRSCS